MNNSYIKPLEKVIEGNFCVGCGACAYVLNIPMIINQHGEFNPDLQHELDENNITPSVSDVSSICPFLAPELNENELAKPLFADDCEFDERIGYHYSSYAGFVKEESFRENGTSGGMGSWIGAELMRLGEIDAVIHVKPNKNRSDGEPFFKYDISNTVEEVCSGSKTRYHVVEVSEVMSLVKEKPGKYLFIGVPCLCKSIRRLQLVDPVINDRIKYVASLVCGHLKSIHWTLSLAWGAGIEPSDLKTFQYRTKGPGIPARAYVFRAAPIDESQTVQKNSAEVTGGKFNAGALMLNACDFCDDVVGETSDITIGDAWIPKYEVDSFGTNLLIVRNRKLDVILKQANAEERILITKITKDEAAESQSGGIRQRREGLSYRLDKNKNSWTPIKRIKPGSFKISRIRMKIYDRRMHVAKLSRNVFSNALKNNDYDYYHNIMGPEFKKLRAIELRSSFVRSVINRLKRYLYSAIGSKI